MMFFELPNLGKQSYKPSQANTMIPVNWRRMSKEYNPMIGP